MKTMPDMWRSIIGDERADELDDAALSFLENVSGERWCDPEDLMYVAGVFNALAGIVHESRCHIKERGG